VTIIVAPKSALAPTRPSVGIFWRVNGVLVIDRSTLDEAEPYGECITHAAGHYERWQEWQALGGARRAAAGYPDRIASIDALKTAFGLTESKLIVRIRSDSHYR
jgi:hypothetical protein